jgi:hypothetical protein
LDGIRYRLAQNEEIDLFTTWVSIDDEEKLNKPVEKSINFMLEFGKMFGKEWSLGALIGVRTNLAKKFKFDEKQKVGEDGIFVKTLIDNGYNFKIIRDPRYGYSLRRLEKEGVLHYIRSSAKIALNYFQGKDFKEEDFGYQMNGGGYYNSKNSLNFFKLPEYIKSLSKKQLEQAKRLFKSLTEVGF